MSPEKGPFKRKIVLQHLPTNIFQRIFVNFRGRIFPNAVVLAPSWNVRSAPTKVSCSLFDTLRGVLGEGFCTGYQKNPGWWFQIFFYVHPYLGKWSNLTNIFQMGWNHQNETQAQLSIGIAVLKIVWLFQTCYASCWSREFCSASARRKNPEGFKTTWLFLSLL